MNNCLLFKIRNVLVLNSQLPGVCLNSAFFKDIYFNEIDMIYTVSNCTPGYYRIMLLCPIKLV